MTLVFVGGHADGVRQDVPDNVVCWDVAVLPNPKDMVIYLDTGKIPTEPTFFKFETYKRVQWKAYEDGSGLLKERQFMLLVGTPMIDAIDMILEGYHPKVKDTQ